MDDLWDLIHRATAVLDARNGRSGAEVDRRLLKLVEEIGEVAQARIGMLGQNPRKGVTHTVDDVASELCDVVITALVALDSLTRPYESPERKLAEVVAHRVERLEGVPLDGGS